jgi:hypothetical protein
MSDLIGKIVRCPEAVCESGLLWIVGYQRPNASRLEPWNVYAVDATRRGSERIDLDQEDILNWVNQHGFIAEEVAERKAAERKAREAAAATPPA